MDEKVISELIGMDAVKEWFGGWPSFHDAEIISLSLVRTGPSLLRVYPYTPQKPATVDFVFDNVTDVELSDFSSQNVISGLYIEKAIDRYDDPV
jgi:hypothetical protein